VRRITLGFAVKRSERGRRKESNSVRQLTLDPAGVTHSQPCKRPGIGPAAQAPQRRL